MSPDYRLEARRVNGKTEVVISAKDDQAADRAPITFSGEFRFPATDDGDRVGKEVDDAFAYGGDFELSGDFVGPITVDAPSELGISGTSKPVRFWVSSLPERLDSPLLATLTVLSTAGLPRQALEISFRERLCGDRGVTLRGGDTTGMLKLQVRVNTSGSGDVTVSVRQGPLGTPASVLPMLRLLLAFRPPNQLKLALEGGDQPLLEMPISEPFADEHLEEVVALIEQMVTIQDHTRSVFAVPAALTARDATTIRNAARLIGGEHVPIAEGRVSFTFTPHEPGLLPELFAGDFQLAHTLEHTRIRIAGRELDLGPSVSHIRCCRLINREMLEHVPDSSITIELELPPGESAFRFLGDIPTSGQTGWVRPV